MNETIAAEQLEVEALLLSRAYLYTLFHKLFGGYPSADLIEAMRSPVTLDVVDEYAEDDQTMAGLRTFLANFAAKDGATDAEQLAESVSGEYTRLFVGPGRPEAFPIESPYITNEATYFQENTLRVRDEYRRRGLEPKRVGHTPDDHIALECDLMARLGRRSLDALRAGEPSVLAESLRDAEAFSAQHLAWTADLALAARRGTTAQLYPQLCEALAAFVKLDETFLAEASLWAEQLTGEDFASERTVRPDSFATVEQAIEHLRELRLFGLEDNELVEREAPKA